MTSKYFREQCRYTQSELIYSFECDEQKGINIIRKLKEFNVLKAVKANDMQKNLSDLDFSDEEVSEVCTGSDEYFYVFSFVGVIVVNGIILKIYPKYILSGEDKKNKLKRVIKVIEKYNSREEIIKMVNGTDENTSFNILAVMLYLIKDYYDYGLISNTKDIIESNGFGEIIWDRTINETFTFVSNNCPYYFELKTKKRINDDLDFLQKLHACILTKCSKELEDADLLDLFDITSVNLTEDDIDDFGDQEAILYKLTNELNLQFNTRKQLLIKLLYAYIAQDINLEYSEGLSLFGTNSFNLIWEDVCSNVLNNQLKRPLGSLNLPFGVQEGYDSKKSLIEQIEKPQWESIGDSSSNFTKIADATLIPDLVSIFCNKKDYTFFIFDAKYYNLQLEIDKPLLGQPGIESISKQYLYQLAYKEFTEKHHIEKVRNSFLFPTEENNIIFKGYVHLSILERIGLQPIEIWLLPAHKMFQYYLQGTSISEDEFNINKIKIM